MYMRYVVLVTLCIFLFSFSTTVQADDTFEKQYAIAKSELVKLATDAKKSSYRDAWERVEKRFVDLEKLTRHWGNAPAVSYRLGVVREGLARRSMNRNDYERAARTYEDVARAYPRSVLADDALLSAALLRLNRLGDSIGGKANLRRIVQSYSRGDMVSHAKALLAGKNPATLYPPHAAELGLAATPKQQKASGQAILKRVSWKSSSSQASVVIHFDRKAGWKHQFIAAKAQQPARLVIDIDNSLVAKPVQALTAVGGKVLSRIHVATLDAKKTRVTIEFNAIHRYDVQLATNDGYQLAIVASATPAMASTVASAPVSSPATKPAKKNPPKAQPKAVLEPPKNVVEQLGLGVHTIMIDAGHGGKDPGAMGNSLKESTVVLDVAQRLAKALRAKGFSVVLTRDKNVFIPLSKRTQLANNKSVDLFISIHVNANKKSSISGIETYYLSNASTSSAAKVAARENAVSEKNLSDLQLILSDLMLDSKTQESRALANNIQKSLVERMKRAGYGSLDNGMRSAPFYVLMGARMPAVLVELGYCTNAREAKRLATSKYRAFLVEGLVQGIVGYKKTVEAYSAR